MIARCCRLNGQKRLKKTTTTSASRAACFIWTWRPPLGVCSIAGTRHSPPRWGSRIYRAATPVRHSRLARIIPASLDVRGNPLLKERGHLQAVLFEHDHVAVAVNPLV